MDREQRIFELKKKHLTYYELFNVTRDAEMNAIKRSFRAITLKFHPDKARSEAERVDLEDVFPYYSFAHVRCICFCVCDSLYYRCVTK